MFRIGIPIIGYPRNHQHQRRQKSYCSSVSILRRICLCQEIEDWKTIQHDLLICGVPRGEFRPRQTRQLPRAVDLKGAASKLSKLLIK